MCFTDLATENIGKPVVLQTGPPKLLENHWFHYKTSPNHRQPPAEHRAGGSPMSSSAQGLSTYQQATCRPCYGTRGRRPVCILSQFGLSLTTPGRFRISIDAQMPPSPPATWQFMGVLRCAPPRPSLAGS